MINPILTSLATGFFLATPAVADSAMRRFLPALGPTPRGLIVATVTVIVLGAVQLPSAAGAWMLCSYVCYRICLRIIGGDDQTPHQRSRAAPARSRYDTASAMSGYSAASARSGYGDASAMSGYGAASARSRYDAASAIRGYDAVSARSGYGAASARSGYDEALGRFTDAEQSKISKFINKLKETRDYSSKSWRFDEQIRQVLERAFQDSEFKKALMLRVEDAQTGCSDNSAHVFNQILTDFYVTEKGITVQELGRRLIGCKRAKLLEEEVGRWCIKRRCDHESVERGLYCHIELATQLGLPVAVTTMAYPSCAANVTNSDLVNFRDTILNLTNTPENQAAILLQEERWLERLREDHQAAFDKIQADADTEMEAIEARQSTLLDQAYLNLITACSSKLDVNKQALYKELTFAHLSKYPI